MQRQLQVGIESILAGNSSSSSPGYCSEVVARKYSNGQAQANLHCICLASTVVTEWGCINSLATNGSVVYAGTQNGSILVYEKGPNYLVPVAQITCCGPVKALLVQENRAYTAHHDNKVRVWRKQPRLKLLKTLPTVKDRIQKWMISSHNNFVQTNKKRLHSRIRPWIEHFDVVTSLALCTEEDQDEEDILYSGSWDKTVKVWRLSDFSCLESINAHDDAVNALTTARNGILFSGSADGSIKVWKRTLRTSSLPVSMRPHHQHLTTLNCHSHGHVDDGNLAVNCLALSPDESILYCGTSKGEINYWRMDKGSLHICYEDALSGHERSVLCLTTLRKFVCSGSADTTIRVWVREAASIGSGSFFHSCLQVLEGHRGPVKCITAVSSVPELLSSFSTSVSSSSSSPSNNSSASSQYHNLTRNGFLVYSGSLDATIKLWWVY